MSNKRAEYKVGQSVVHLSHGMGTVTGIEEREFSPNRVQKFYIISIQDNGAPKKVFVPFDSTDKRLRSVVTRQQAKEVILFIEANEVDATLANSPHRLTWNRRYREYMELIHTGQLMDVTRVFLALRQDKELSFGERKLRR